MERGVRQAFPISPLLFIFLVEPLARNERSDNNIKGIQFNGVHRPVKIKQYADDIILFLKDIIDFREVVSKIKMFSGFSGQELNKDKSLAMLVYNPNNEMLKINNGIGFVDKFKNLGIYLSNEGKATDITGNFEPHIEKF